MAPLLKLAEPAASLFSTLEYPEDKLVFPDAHSHSTGASFKGSRPLRLSVMLISFGAIVGVSNLDVDNDLSFRVGVHFDQRVRVSLRCM